MRFEQAFPSLAGHTITHKTKMGCLIPVYDDDVIMTFCIEKKKVEYELILFGETLSQIQDCECVEGVMGEVCGYCKIRESYLNLRKRLMQK